MSDFINRISDGFVNFEKCGDVVVSPKDNVIGIFCHYCCDIYSNLSEFLHHLHSLHNDVLSFTKAYNVYSVEELMSTFQEPPEDIQSQANSSSSTDSGLPADATEAKGNNSCEMESEMKPSIDMNQTILNATESEMQCQAGGGKCVPEEQTIKTEESERDILVEVEAMLLKDEEVGDDKEHALELEQMLEAAGLHDIQVDKVPPQSTHLKHKQQSVHVSETTIKSTFDSNSERVCRHRESAKIKSEKQPSHKPTCDLKSYAIARSTRKREQQQRMYTIKKRIFFALKNEQRSLLKTTMELSQLEKLLEEESPMQSPPTEENIKQGKENKVQPLQSLSLEAQSATHVSTATETIKLENTVRPTKIINAKHKLRTQNPSRRPSFPAPNMPKIQPMTFKKELLKQETEPNPTNKRKQSTLNKLSSSIVAIEPKRPKTDLNTSPNFGLSDSVVAFLQSDLNATQLDADSLLHLAEPSEEDESDSFESILNQVVGEQKEIAGTQSTTAAPTDVTNENMICVTPTNIIRGDTILLKIVGLPIIKDDHYEDLKQVEFCDMLRTKAVKFSTILQRYETVWNPKRFNAELTENHLVMLTKEANSEFCSILTVSEVKRILNLINGWHSQRIDLQHFKKAILSPTVAHYLRLFAFLPKINRCLYYCEWCEETRNDKALYGQHRLTHVVHLTCPHCKRSFKKHGFLMNHLRSLHGQDMECITVPHEL